MSKLVESGRPDAADQSDAEPIVVERGLAIQGNDLLVDRFPQPAVNKTVADGDFQNRTSSPTTSGPKGPMAGLRLVMRPVRPRQPGRTQPQTSSNASGVPASHGCSPVKRRTISVGQCLVKREVRTEMTSRRCL